MGASFLINGEPWGFNEQGALFEGRRQAVDGA